MDEAKRLQQRPIYPQGQQAYSHLIERCCWPIDLCINGARQNCANITYTVCFVLLSF